MPDSHEPLPGPDPAGAKRALRRDLLAARRTRGPAAPGATAALTGLVLDLPELDGVSRVALYVSAPDEPDTGPLVAALHARGVEVLLPVLLDDDDLDWAPWSGPDHLVTGRRGTRHPDTPAQGVGAIGGVDVAFVPGLAVGPDGMRLGRGGGSYDRALARLPRTVPVVVLLHPGETDRAVPAEPHDRAVHVAVTEQSVHRWVRG